DRAVAEQAVTRGHRGHAEVRAEIVGSLVGQRYGLVLVHHGPFGGGYPLLALRGEPEPHALPDTVGIDSLAHRVDRSGAVLVRNLELVDRARGRAVAGFHVRGVEPGHRDVHAHLTRARFGSCRLGHTQHVAGGAVRLVQR